MDTALCDGDFAVTSGGLPTTVEGKEELLQQARIRLTVRQGSFAYDSSLGSDLYLLQKEDPDVRRMAMEAVQEALRACPQIQVRQVLVTGTGVRAVLTTGYGDGVVDIPLWEPILEEAESHG